MDDPPTALPPFPPTHSFHLRISDPPDADDGNKFADQHHHHHPLVCLSLNLYIRLSVSCSCFRLIVRPLSIASSLASGRHRSLPPVDQLYHRLNDNNS